MKSWCEKQFWSIVIRPFGIHISPLISSSCLLVSPSLSLSTVDNVDSPMLVEKIDDPSVHQLSIKDLDRHSRYHFLLRGRTAAGDGLPITKVGATTLDGGAVFSLSLTLPETGRGLPHLSARLLYSRSHRFLNIASNLIILNCYPKSIFYPFEP